MSYLRANRFVQFMKLFIFLPVSTHGVSMCLIQKGCVQCCFHLLLWNLGVRPAEQKEQSFIKF